jgi:hypothetical protein
VVPIEKVFPLSGFRREFVGDAVNFLLLGRLRGVGLIQFWRFRTFGFVWHGVYLLFPAYPDFMRDNCR